MYTYIVTYLVEYCSTLQGVSTGLSRQLTNSKSELRCCRV